MRAAAAGTRRGREALARRVDDYFVDLIAFAGLRRRYTLMPRFWRLRAGDASFSSPATLDAIALILLRRRRGWLGVSRAEAYATPGRPCLVTAC